MADQISKSALALAKARAGEAEWRNSWAGGGTHGSALVLENMVDQISESALALARAGAFLVEKLNGGTRGLVEARINRRLRLKTWWTRLVNLPLP